jgi:hypothetical protein
MNDWLPIDEVTPENCPDGSRVRIRWDDQEESEPEFYDAIIHWVNGGAVLKPPLTRAATYNTPDAVKPCDK